MSLPYDPAYWDGKPIMDAIVYPQDEDAEEKLTEEQAEAAYIKDLMEVRDDLAGKDLEEILEESDEEAEPEKDAEDPDQDEASTGA